MTITEALEHSLRTGTPFVQKYGPYSYFCFIVQAVDTCTVWVENIGTDSWDAWAAVAMKDGDSVVDWIESPTIQNGTPLVPPEQYCNECGNNPKHGHRSYCSASKGLSYVEYETDERGAIMEEKTLSGSFQAKCVCNIVDLMQVGCKCGGT